MPLSDDYKKQECINGTIYDMSPSADYRHGLVNLNIHRCISSQLRNSLCLVFAENLDWKYNASKNDYVIPDIMIICDRKNIVKGTYSGIPKFIVETLSPSTTLRDRTTKKEIYEEKGVEEYWIVDVKSCSLEIYHLVNDTYSLIDNYILEHDDTDPGYNADTEVSLKAFPNVKLQLKEIFENVYE